MRVHQLSLGPQSRKPCTNVITPWVNSIGGETWLGPFVECVRQTGPGAKVKVVRTASRTKAGSPGPGVPISSTETQEGGTSL